MRMSNDTERVALIVHKEKEYKVTFKERLTSCRWHVGYVTCLTLACTMLMRMNMSMVVVCMNPPNMTTNVVVNGTNVTVVDDYMKYYVQWDSTMEGLLISGNYIGQVVTALTLGTMSGRYSGKYIITSMVLVMAVSTAITPGFVFVSQYTVLALRIIVGMATSGLEPCATQLLSNWAPLQERAQMMVLVETARSVGGMANYILAGLLCSIPFFGGWPFIFFVFNIDNTMGATDYLEGCMGLCVGVPYLRSSVYQPRHLSAAVFRTSVRTRSDIEWFCVRPPICRANIWCDLVWLHI
ncbi:uncharacterized transporter slc-17.2-like isoform X2 [Pecten maximus]|uniref:uncharacterized transporter slc-17.2-like isoform X2 n=1 Tax=Pecten maximus TaxID=6579 RepID=UPI0014584356|nr:uncharacterized transporter slc-17.2-like isoform X2 [Pecten maximus]